MRFIRYVKTIAARLIEWLTQLFKAKPAHITQINKNQTIENKNRLQPPKPPWVKLEIIRLKAYLPQASGYTIAATFNRMYADSRSMTVGKTYVYNVIKQHQYDILTRQKKIKTKQPASYLVNALWQMDLTYLPRLKHYGDLSTNNHHHLLLGIIDAGSRACLALQQTRTKATIGILRHLLDCIEQYGRPKAIRTDNEACFNSVLFNICLMLLGIRHQTIQICSPWQNGRVERFFGTFKRYARQIHWPECPEQTQQLLITFTSWYNHTRRHRNLNYQTPAEAWNQQLPNPYNTHYYVSEWGDILTGYYFPP